METQLKTAESATVKAQMDYFSIFEKHESQAGRDAAAAVALDAKQKEPKVQRGILLKRKKWLGGWSERQFVLEGTVLSYAYPKGGDLARNAMGMAAGMAVGGLGGGMGGTDAEVIEWGSFSQHYIIDPRCKVQLQQESFGGYVLLLTLIGENGKPEEMTLKPHVSSDILTDMDGKNVDKVLRECETWAVALSNAINISKERGTKAAAGTRGSYSTSGRPLDAKVLGSVGALTSSILDSGKKAMKQAAFKPSLDDLVA
jgi:hypothetical protein